MAVAVVRRLLHAAISLVGISFVVFVLIRAAPGDPVLLHVGGVGARGVSPEVLAQLRADYGLDKPVVLQYLTWLRASVRLDFGESFMERKPVSALLAARLPATLLLLFSSLAIALLVGVPMGMLNARFAGGRGDVAWGVAATAIYSIPTFWLALLLLHLLSVRFHLLPLFGMPPDELQGAGAKLFSIGRYMALPVATLAAGQIAFFSRFVRASMLDARGRDYMRTARAKGLSEWGAIARHGMRNTISPLVSLLSVTFPALLSACVVVERIFRWQGIGNLFVESVVARDYPVVMGLTLFTAVLSLAAAYVAELIQLAVDPRFRKEGEA